MANDDGIYVTGIFRLKDEAIADFCDGMPELLKATRARKGCRYIKVIRHLDRADEFLFLEEWDTNEDYQAYLDWRKSTGISMADKLKEPQRFDRWQGRID
ncbi:MAG: antibiotic biosynthesis monooxygenase family protein [Sphingobium sp.]